MKTKTTKQKPASKQLALAIAAPPVMTRQLSETEAARLAELEAIIESGRETYRAAFASVAKAVCEIRDNPRYWQKHKTFVKYCQARYGWNRSYAYSMATAGDVLKSLLNSAIAEWVTNEAQTRELNKVPVEHRAAVIKATTAKGCLTARTIRNAASTLAAPPTPAITAPESAQSASPAAPEDWLKNFKYHRKQLIAIARKHTVERALIEELRPLSYMMDWVRRMHKRFSGQKTRP
jgi:hypothetical protein